MALTTDQADPKHLLNSVVAWLSRTVKTPYDAGLGSTTWSTPLKVRIGAPDDEEMTLAPPVIAVNFLESANSDPDLGIGDPDGRRFRNFSLYCYPSLDNNKQPSLAASLYLQKHIDNALGSRLRNIRVIDYGNPACTSSNVLFTGESMYILKTTGPMPRGSKIAIAEERHRFDYGIHVWFPVAEQVTN